MDERQKELARIKARMKELDYNPRSLSMKLFGKPDRLRNLFKGKAKSWREDTYRAIMAELWPDQVAAPLTLSEEDVKNGQQGLLGGIEGLLFVLLSKRLVSRGDLEVVFNSQMRDFRARNQSGAASVMDQLLDFLHSKLPESVPLKDHKSSRPARVRSRIEKTLET